MDAHNHRRYWRLGLGAAAGTVVAGCVLIGTAQLASSDETPPKTPSPEQQAQFDAQFEEMWSQIDTSGMVPIGMTPQGGPVGWVSAEDYERSGTSDEPMPVHSRSGAVTHYAVEGYGLVPRAVYEDPARRAEIDTAAAVQKAERERLVSQP